MIDPQKLTQDQDVGGECGGLSTSIFDIDLAGRIENVQFCIREQCRLSAHVGMGLW